MDKKERYIYCIKCGRYVGIYALLRKKKPVLCGVCNGSGKTKRLEKKQIHIIIRVYGVLFLSFGWISAMLLGYSIYESNLVLTFLSGIFLSLSYSFFKLYRKNSLELRKIMINIKKTIDYIDSNYNNKGSE